MGIMVGLPSPSGSEKDLQLNFGKNMTVQVEMRAPHLPAEWHTQSGIQLTWPHAGTDWAYMLTEVQELSLIHISTTSVLFVILILTVARIIILCNDILLLKLFFPLTCNKPLSLL